jgi:GNAT superfamily N-acetyltransferase
MASADPHRPADRPDDPHAEPDPALRVRLTRPEDIPALIALSRRVYPEGGAWLTKELRAHQAAFPEGQLVVVDRADDRPLGMVVSLVVDSNRWPPDASWGAVTDEGRLTTHDPDGDTLYGAGLAVDPEARGRGAARLLYQAREALLERMGLQRIRAGARIPGYGRAARRMSPDRYVDEVIAGSRSDPTLSFQLHMGFRVVAVARDYLPGDRDSRGHAAVVEWLPPDG